MSYLHYYSGLYRLKLFRYQTFQLMNCQELLARTLSFGQDCVIFDHFRPHLRERGTPLKASH